MRGRIYDPKIGRFMQADPIIQFGSSQGLNRYSYVRNNPMNGTDPSGFCGEECELDYEEEEREIRAEEGFVTYTGAGEQAHSSAGAAHAGGNAGTSVTEGGTFDTVVVTMEAVMAGSVSMQVSSGSGQVKDSTSFWDKVMSVAEGAWSAIKDAFTSDNSSTATTGGKTQGPPKPDPEKAPQAMPDSHSAPSGTQPPLHDSGQGSEASQGEGAGVGGQSSHVANVNFSQFAAQGGVTGVPISEQGYGGTQPNSPYDVSWIDLGGPLANPAASGTQFGAGVTLDFTFVLGTEGGSTGWNLQWLSDGGLALYAYGPNAGAIPFGANIGVGVSGNIAWGPGGAWTGAFNNYNVTVPGATVGHFGSPDGSWNGIQGGPGEGWGASGTQTNYVLVIPLSIPGLFTGIR